MEVIHPLVVFFVQLRVSLLESQELLIGEILTVHNILEALAIFALVDHLQTRYSDVQFS